MKPESRCDWANNKILIDYHDNEWGKPVHDDDKLFEILILESMQAGLSWFTILKRRDTLRTVFDNFIPSKIMLFNDKKVEELMQNEGIIRHLGKIKAAIHNAKLFVDIQQQYGSFDKFIWQYINYEPIINNPQNISDVQSRNAISNKISKDLQKIGFKFISSTTIYAFMQAIGMFNDHLTCCGWKNNC